MSSGVVSGCFLTRPMGNTTPVCSIQRMQQHRCKRNDPASRMVPASQAMLLDLYIYLIYLIYYLIYLIALRDDCTRTILCSTTKWDNYELHFACLRLRRERTRGYREAWDRGTGMTNVCTGRCVRTAVCACCRLSSVLTLPAGSPVVA